jgi:hypothetical protein
MSPAERKSGVLHVDDTPLRLISAREVLTLVQIHCVSEQQDVIGDLEAALVLAGVRWAYRSATTRTLETYSEADDHDAAWLGNTRFTPST